MIGGKGTCGAVAVLGVWGQMRGQGGGGTKCRVDGWASFHTALLLACRHDAPHPCGGGSPGDSVRQAHGSDRCQSYRGKGVLLARMLAYMCLCWLTYAYAGIYGQTTCQLRHRLRRATPVSRTTAVGNSSVKLRPSPSGTIETWLDRIDRWLLNLVFDPRDGRLVSVANALALACNHACLLAAGLSRSRAGYWLIPAGGFDCRHCLDYGNRCYGGWCWNPALTLGLASLVEN